MGGTDVVDGPLTNQRVLITGGAGFIGSHLAAALVPDNTVTVLDDLSGGSREAVPAAANLVVGDIREEDLLADLMAETDVVFHEAAVVSVEHSIEAPIETNTVNLDATLALLEAARRTETRVVLASSAAIYGDPDSVPVAETDPTTGTSPYGVAKLAGDQYARVYHSLYGLETTALRYFNVYGPHQRSGAYSAVIDVFVEQARAGGPITVQGDGEQTRDFVHVRDVVQANVLAATTDAATGTAINVGTGEATTIRALAEAIRDGAGSDADIVHTDARAGDIRHSCADITRARNCLGFEPTVSLSEGLRTIPAIKSVGEATTR